MEHPEDTTAPVVEQMEHPNQKMDITILAMPMLTSPFPSNLISKGPASLVVTPAITRSYEYTKFPHGHQYETLRGGLPKP